MKQKNSLFKVFFICLIGLASLGSLLPNKAYAQTGATITGRISDDLDGLLLPGVSVKVKGTQKGAVTGQDGRYRIENVTGENVVIKATYIGYQDAEFPVEISAGGVVTLNMKLKPGVVYTDEVVVIGERLRGQAKALNQQKNSINVTNVVAADQVGKFPDANIGDALKRIPGITVFNDQGEARFGHIRGTEPRFNSVTINGERIPSAEAENRTIQLDLIPSDMIQTIEVNKALTPDMDGDAIGGSINLVTKMPSEERISISTGGGYNFLEETGGPRYQLGATYGNRVFEDKLGVLFSFSYENNDFGSDNIEAEWDAGDDGIEGIKEFQERTYDVQRIRRSFSGALDYQLNANNILKFNGIYNWRDDFENRFRTEYKDLDEAQAEIERQTKAGNEENARLEDQRMMSFALSGEHSFGKLDMDWQATYAKASEDRPGERYLTLKAEGQDFSADISNPEKPFVTLSDPAVSGGLSNDAVWNIDELTEENQFTEDIDMNFSLNLNYEFSNALTVKFGGRYRDKDKKRDNDFFEYESNNEVQFRQDIFANLEDQSKDNFLPGSKYKAGTFVSNEFLGSLDLNNSNLYSKELINEELAGNFDATEQIIAGYAMATYDLSPQTSILGGLRFETTSNEYNAFEYNEDTDDLTAVKGKSTDYTNVLPYLHVRQQLDDFTNVKVAFTQSLARPNYFDLAPYREIVPDDNELKIGNPDLEPTLSTNIDVMAERYLSGVGILSAGFFYKSISDFIITQKQTVDVGGDDYDQFQPINAGDGTLWGLEAAVQYQVPAVKGLGLYLNYTYTNSSIDNFKIEGREDDNDLPLPGSAEHTLNASISYEIAQFYVRLSGNYHSDFIDSEEGSIGENKFEDRYQDQAFHLDLNGGYDLNEMVRFYFEFNNLTNEAFRFYQGESKYLAQEEWYDRKFTIGVKADF